MYMHSLTHQLFIFIIICACMAVMTLDTSAVKKEASNGSGCIMITPAIFIMLQMLLSQSNNERGWFKADIRKHHLEKCGTDTLLSE